LQVLIIAVAEKLGFRTRCSARVATSGPRDAFRQDSAAPIGGWVGALRGTIVRAKPRHKLHYEGGLAARLHGGTTIPETRSKPAGPSKEPARRAATSRLADAVGHRAGAESSVPPLVAGGGSASRIRRVPAPRGCSARFCPVGAKTRSGPEATRAGAATRREPLSTPGRRGGEGKRYGPPEGGKGNPATPGKGGRMHARQPRAARAFEEGGGQEGPLFFPQGAARRRRRATQEGRTVLTWEKHVAGRVRTTSISEAGVAGPRRELGYAPGQNGRLVRDARRRTIPLAWSAVAGHGRPALVLLSVSLGNRKGPRGVFDFVRVLRAITLRN